MKKNKIILITGTSKGIGRFLVEYYTSLGYHVIGCSRNDAKYSLQGEVSDKGSKKIYINVKDEFSQNSVKVVNGKFTINRYSPEDEEIEIIATDSWGNKSKKTVKVKICFYIAHCES